MSSLINTKPELYLGWAYDRVEESDKNNPYIDKIGGKPIWLNQNCPPPTNYSICDNCGERLFFLMQLQGHINKRKYDRVFYVFGCNNSQCMGKEGSFKVLRAHKGTHFKKHSKINKTMKKAEEIPQLTIDDNDFNSTPIESQSFINSENDTIIKHSIDMSPVIIDPKEFEKEIDEIKEINNNENGFEFGFGNVTDFNWETPGFGNSNDDWGSFGNDDNSNGFGFGDNSNVFGSNNDTNDKKIDDLNKLLELRNKKYEEEESDDDYNNESQKKQEKKEQKIEKKAKNIIKQESNPKELIENEKENNSDKNINIEKVEEETEENKEELENLKQYWNKGRFFPDYYLDMDLDQPNNKEDDYSHEKKLIEEYEKQNKLNGNNSTDINWGEEKYEKSDNKYYNKVFRKFNEVVQEEPEQCLRYCIKGEPLFYDNDDISKKYSNSKNIPKCERCGALRTFEFQLMPNLLSILPTEKFLNKHKPYKNIRNIKDVNTISKSDLINQFDTGMEWGTILVFTCSKDCDMDELKQKEIEDDGMWREDVSYYEELPVVEKESLF
ncbi:hypothetical protein BCR36DRAFT_320712 [Piromyces finnis]|uniref:Programmed cell death protein 2 C-terminal domain-containing protein n=1 Tax=Piromyces finnis TaxID=1754191 RepID=A0A1Y1VGY2_9FUNG|nr:hypothetical protein BCR36DRAFT_320712 [Piromyces finnis]|eukprot:ORX55988.1 hypothetical protein BCR36DRAFT_320712 [Piromyces finnis]